MIVRGFREEDLYNIELRNFDIEVLRREEYVTQCILASKDLFYTAVRDDGTILCIAGVVPIRQNLRHGEAVLMASDFSLMSSAEIRKIIRCTRKQLDSFMKNIGFIRIQASVLADSDTHIKFVEYLGFSREGLLRKYGIMGEDQYMYSLI